MKLRYLSKAPLFGELPHAFLEQIAEKMRLHTFARGETIFPRGGPSDALYLIKSGWVHLRGEGNALIATLGPGSLLGEADVLLQRPHSIGATAADVVEAWSLPAEALNELIRAYPENGLILSEALGQRIAALEQYLVDERLRVLPAFASLPDEILKALAGAMELTRFPAQSPLFREGEPAPGLFLIERGRVQLFSSCDADGEYVELGPGDLLGELPALTGKPCMSTARALEDTLAWALASTALGILMERYPVIRKALSETARERLSAEDQEAAAAKLRELPLFAGLTPEALAEVAAALVLRHVPAGEAVYRHSDSGDSLYLIESGEVRVLPEEHEATSFRLRAGEFFGETALLTGRPRSVTVKAETDTNLWVLYRTDFERLVNKYPAISLALSRLLSERLAAADRTFVTRHMRHLSLLAGLSTQQLEDVNDRLRPAKFRAGEVILREGTYGDVMYLIESGQVEVVAGADSPVLLATLGDGDFFGEMALLTGRPRIATVRAVTDVDLWALQKADFDELLLKYPALTVALSKVLSQRLSGVNSRLISERLGRPVRPVPAPEPVTAPVPRTTPAMVRRQPALAPAERPSPAFGLQRSVVNAVQGLRRSFDSAAAWFGARSTPAKARLVALVLLLAWLGGVAAPATIISLLSSEVSLGSSANAVRQSTPENSAPADMENAVLGAAEMATDTAAALLTLAPTDTPASTDTPVPPTPTFTPVPPTPTETPVPPTPTATYTPLPPKESAPVAAAAAAPAPKEQPAAAAVQQPSLPPVQWDGRLDAMGVHIAGVDVPAGQPYWRVVKVQWGNEQESQGKHHIYVEVLDEAGNRLTGQPVVVFWPGGQEILHTENKPAPEYACNFPMYAVLGTYSVRVDGLPSETLVGLGMGTPELPAWKIHTTFYITFQRTVR